MKVRILKQLLKRAGYYRVRAGKGDHEVWGNDTGLTFPVDGSGGTEIKTGTLNAILRQAGITLEIKRKKRRSKT